MISLFPKVRQRVIAQTQKPKELIITELAK
jgi:hypothetical protein